MKYLLLILLACSAHAELTEVWSQDGWRKGVVDIDRNQEKILYSISQKNNDFLFVDIDNGDSVGVLHSDFKYRFLSNYSYDNKYLGLLFGGMDAGIIDHESSTISSTFTSSYDEAPNGNIKFYNSMGFSSDTSFFYICGSSYVDNDNHIDNPEEYDNHRIDVIDYENDELIDSLSFGFKYDVIDSYFDFKSIHFIPNSSNLLVYFSTQNNRYDNLLLWDYEQDSIMFHKTWEINGRREYIIKINKDGNAFYYCDGFLKKMRFDGDLDSLFIKPNIVTSGYKYDVSPEEEYLLYYSTFSENNQRVERTYLFDLTTSQKIDSLEYIGEYFFVSDTRFVVENDSIRVFDITTSSAVEIDNFESLLYPNPSSGLVNVSTEWNSYHYKLIDLKGNLVQEGDHQGENELQLNITNEGSYLLIMENGSNIKSIKIIKE